MRATLSRSSQNTLPEGDGSCQRALRPYIARRRTVFSILIGWLAATAFVLAWLTPAASASRPFTPELAVSASTYAAGQHPDLTINVTKERDGFHDGDPPSFYDEQDLEEMQIALPPGLTINPRALPFCNLQSGAEEDYCADPGSQIGTGETDVEVWVPFSVALEMIPDFCTSFPDTCDYFEQEEWPDIPICLPSPLTATIYNEEPLAGEQARTVTIVNGITVSEVTICGLENLFEQVFGDPYIQVDPISMPGFSMANGATLDPETLAPTLAAENMPNTVDTEIGGSPLTLPLGISRLSLTLEGDRGSSQGYSLISNPTSCEAHSVNGTFTSYGDDNVTSADDRTVTASADYPVDSCDALPYNPQLQLILDPATPSGKPTLTQVITQGPGEAATGSVTFSMPASFKMNPDRIFDICSDEQIAARSCPATSQLATVSIETPLLADPLTGAAYMGPAVGDRVQVVTFLDGPVSMTMEGTLWQRSDGGMDTVTQDMPDMPVDRLEYTSLGGDQATFLNPADCGTHTATATFVSRSGKTVTSSQNIDITGCVAASGDIWQRLHASILPRKKGRRARMRLLLAQDPGTELKWIRYKVSGGLRWRLSRHKRRRALGAVEIRPEDGTPKEYDLYPRSSRRTRLVLKTRSRKYPVTVRIKRKLVSKCESKRSSKRKHSTKRKCRKRLSKRATLKVTRLPKESTYDIAVRIFGKRNRLLRTPRRCRRDSPVNATVKAADGTRTKVATTWSPGCRKRS